MTTLSILGLHFGFYSGKCLECSWDPLSFALHIVAKLLCFCLYLFDAIVELHAMNEKLFNDFLIEK
jgi:hypothetical protein